jgi:endonuclease-3
VSDPFDIVLFECVAYLVDDERRLAVWRALKREIGVTPQAILKHSPAAIAAVIEPGGMQPLRRAQKLIDAAQIVVDECDGSLKAALAALPLPRARSLLKRFPNVGDPGADRILMLTRRANLLALDSNGLRALQRLGYGKDSGNYAKDYKALQKAIAGQLPDPPDFDWLIATHLLLRQHGQTLCRRNDPDCDLCPLRRACPFARKIKAS